MDTPPPPTVDSLLLEMLDLLHVSFPQVPSEATISFLPTTDQHRACLSDMECQAAPDSEHRPELGYEDDDLLASMNAVVGDILKTIREQNNKMEHPGHIHIKSGHKDGEVEVAVFEDQPATDPILLQKRIFDFSELQMLIHTPTLFSALHESQDAEEAQSVWLDELLADVASYEMDVETPQFVFSSEDTSSYATFHPALIATYVPTAHSFLWGWAQDQFPPPFLEKTIDLPKNKASPGLRAFQQPELLCPSQMADRLVKHASVSLGARGVYVIEKEGAAGPLLLYVGLFESDDRHP